MKGIIILLVLVILAGCSTYSFEDAFHELEEIDKNFNASFKMERFDKFEVPFVEIQPLLAEVQKLKSEIKDRNFNDKKFALLLIEGRIYELKAEENYHLAKGFGSRGVVNDGFSCNESEEIIKATKYYKESIKNAAENSVYWDDLLFNSEKARELLGIDENKPEFYNSKLQDIEYTIMLNKKALKEVCKINVEKVFNE